MNRAGLLHQITLLDFMAVDLQLFLNTHPQNTEALQMYNDCVANSDDARRQYEKTFGPLSGYRSSNPDGWQWMNEPWPWQLQEGSDQ
jgi:spore coat protein JB